MRTKKDLFNNVEMLCQVANCSFPRIFTLELYTTICCLYLNSLSYTSEDGRIHTTLPSRPAHSSRLVGVFDFSGLWLLCAWLCSPHPQLGEIRYHSWGSWYMEERLVPYILSVVWELVSVTHSNACWQYDSHTKGSAVLSDPSLLQIPGHFQPADGHSGWSSGHHYLGHPHRA